MKSGRTHYSEDAEDKERIIVELKDRICVLENELRLRQKDQINPGIVESEQAAEALRKSEASLARSQAITHLANWEVDVNTGRVWVSDEFYHIFNVEPDAPQEVYVERIHPDDRVGVIESVDAAIYGGKPYSIDYRIVPRPGEVRHVHAEGETIRDGAGRPLSFFGTVQDITERKRMEEELRASEEKFRVLAETAKAGIVLIQGNRFIYVNPTVERVLGYSKDELLAMNYWDVIHPDSMDLLRTRGQSRQLGMPVLSNYELKVLAKSGELRWGEITVGSIAYGDRPTTIATAFDITERKQAEEALRVSEERLLRASRAGCIGLFEWNVDRGMEYLRPEAYELYKLGHGSLATYEKWLSTVHPDDREIVERTFTEAYEKARNLSHISTQLEYRTVHQDGTVLWLLATATCNIEGGDLIVRGAVRDITERKKGEEELASAKSQAELYVDLMGHDINNFNQAARGYLELMDGMVDDEKLKDIISKPMEAIDGSSRLIQNVQKLQRARSGEQRLEALELGDMIEEVAGQFTSVPDDKSVNITCDVIKGVRVRANELLRDVFLNLIGNAIKHSAGLPHIDIRMAPDEGNIGYYKVIIDDNGPGVSDDMKEKIFVRLSRGNTKAKGSGLGLYLVKSLVESYGGRVWVEDKVKGNPAKGARFVVELPTTGC